MSEFVIDIDYLSELERRIRNITIKGEMTSYEEGEVLYSLYAALEERFGI